MSPEILLLPLKNEKSPPSFNQALMAQRVQHSRMLITEPVEEPQDVLYIEEGGRKSILCTLGNLSLIQGQAKSRKTFLLSFICTALLVNEEFLRFTGKLPEKKRKILYFDTEQAPFHAKRVHERIYRLSGLPTTAEYDNIQYYRLRSYNTKERIDIINYVILTTSDVGFVIIDGIRDLVSDINNADESTRITGMLMRLSEEQNVHIQCVLHENKGDRNSRGHIGTELQNKAESVIRVSRDPENRAHTKVEPVYLRDKEFDDFYFDLSDNGTPEIVNGKAHKQSYRYPEDMDESLHKNWVREVFMAGAEFSQNKYLEELKKVAVRYDIHVGNTSLREFVPYHIRQGYIRNEGKGQSFKLVLNL